MPKRRHIKDKDCVNNDEGHSKAIRMSDLENELDMKEFPKERQSESSENPFDSLPDLNLIALRLFSYV